MLLRFALSNQCLGSLHVANQLKVATVKTKERLDCNTWLQCPERAVRGVKGQPAAGGQATRFPSLAAAAQATPRSRRELSWVLRALRGDCSRTHRRLRFPSTSRGCRCTCLTLVTTGTAPRATGRGCTARRPPGVIGACLGVLVKRMQSLPTLDTAKSAQSESFAQRPAHLAEAFSSRGIRRALLFFRGQG
jgi:hypothetical protein